MKQSLRLKLVLALLLTLIVLGIGSTVALARPNNTITVNSTDDTWNPGDGKCTLREAINNANNDTNALPGGSPDCAAGSGADVILLGFGSTFILTQVDSGFAPDTNGMPVITSDITLTGLAGITRQSDAPNFRIFKINATGKLTLNQVVVGGGQIMADGGGIYNAGTLILNYASVDDNTILAPTTLHKGYAGGGIYNLGHLTLNGATIYHNMSGPGGTSSFSDGVSGAPGGDGGGVYNALGATTEIFNSANFNLNQTGAGMLNEEIDHPENTYVADDGYGGAIYNEGTLTIAQSIVVNNVGGTKGGGIAQFDGDMVIVDSQLARNHANFGGGIYVAKGNAHISRSLLEQNYGMEGAALLSTKIEETAPGAIYVSNSTLANNDASQNSFDTTSLRSIVSAATTIVFDYDTIANSVVPSTTGAGVLASRFASHSITLSNSIVTNTADAPNCILYSGGAVINAGNNIDNGSSCGFGNANNSKSNTDPKLSALADNGGPTWTMAIAADSLARDNGNTADCTDQFAGNNLDQRGYTRIQGTNSSCDSGAYEYGASAPVAEPTVTNTPTVTPTNVPAGSTKTPVPPTNTPTPTNTPDPCPTAPVAPTLTSPANNATVTTARVQLKWKAVTCATTYNVTVKLKNKVVDSATGLTTLKFKTKALTRGKTYTWFVQACNAKGCTTSTTSKFKN